jgi:hypothetical protein
VFNKLCKIMLAVLVVGVLAGPAIALADDSGETWIQLDPGEQHWYTLVYQGHHEFEEADEDEDEETKSIFVASQVEIRLDAEPDGGAVFRVVTPEQIRQWVAGEDLESCGCGTENEYDEAADLTWSGNFPEAGEYYLIVQYTGDGTDAVFYTLDIGGQDVSVIAPALEDEGVAVPKASALEATTLKPLAGGGPGDALAPGGSWEVLDVGETRWYAFDYSGHHEFEVVGEDGDEEEKAIWVASQVEVSLDGEPDEAASFSIWTEEQVKLWASDEEFEPVGKGTENEFAPGDLSWSGNFAGPGRYYVVVEQQGPEPAYYLLSISGEDV